MLYAAHLLEGRALNWVQGFLAEYLDPTIENKSPRTEQLFSSFANFAQELKNYCGVQNEEREAERKIWNLKQLGSVSNYAAQFKSITMLLDWDDSSLASHFYRGLKDEIKAIYIHRPRPTTLQGYIDDATFLDSNIHEFKYEKGQQPQIPTKKVTGQANQAKVRQPYYGPMPMDLGQSERRPKKQHRKKGEKLSQKEREERLKKGHCLYCDKPGHQAKDCRAKGQRQNNSAVSQGAIQSEKRSHNVSSNQRAYGTATSKQSQGPVQVASISIGTRRLLREPNYFMHDGKFEIVSITEHYLHGRTRYWNEAPCQRPTCELDAQHTHINYAPQGEAEDAVRLIRLRICVDKECVPEGEDPDEIHVHNEQGQAFPVDGLSTEESLEEDDDQIASIQPLEPEPASEDEEIPESPTALLWEQGFSAIGTEEDQQELITRIQAHEEWVASMRSVRNLRLNEVIRRCTERRALIPKFIETVREGYLSDWYPCYMEAVCPLRTVPHVHIQHYDPCTSWEGINREEAERQAAAQPGPCTNEWCGFPNKRHFHDSKNE